MRIPNSMRVIILLLGFAAPVRASTWSIGACAGFDIVTAGAGSSVLVLGAPVGNEFTTAGVHPGLRIGRWDAGQHHQVFADLGLLSLSGTGFTLHSTAATINYAYAFRSGTSPYLTAGVGFARLAGQYSSASSTLLGAGFGGRQRLAHDHGALRVEARYDHTGSNREYPKPLNTIGVRFGFDLDLN